MIHSRAFLLLRKEFTFFQREEYEEISVSPVGDDFFHWNATIKPKDSLWEGGVFEALIHFSADYNYIAPKVQFLTIPFHPNVHARTGEVFLDITQTWCEENNIPQLFQGLLAIFDTPNLKRGAILNKDAAKMSQLTPHTYRQMVLDCVAASLRVQGGKAPYGEDSGKAASIAVSYRPSETQRHRAKPVSYVDYQTYWKSIATSIADEDGSTVLQTGMNSYAPHKTGEELLEQTMRFQEMIHRYQSLKYGIIRSRDPSGKAKPPQQKRTEHMEQLKALYHQETTDEDNNTSAENNNTSIENTDKDNTTENKDKDNNSDVQELLEWTQQLDADKIDNRHGLHRTFDGFSFYGNL